jgi:hypothetical protein
LSTLKGLHKESCADKGKMLFSSQGALPRPWAELLHPFGVKIPAAWSVFWDNLPNHTSLR